jgi:Tfp pilus assembly protein PilN
MNVENSSDTEARDDVPVEDYFDDIKQSAGTMGGKMGSGIFDLVKLPFLVGVGALVLIILMVFIFSGKGTLTSDGNYQDLEKRIGLLEERIAEMGNAMEDILRLEKRNKRIDVFMDRYARLEADLSLKVDLLEKKLNKIQSGPKEVKNLTPKTLAQKQQKKTSTSRASEEKINTAVHQVRAGDTLYGISRNYGISLDKLKALNPGLKGNSIYPGQKLRVAK